MYINNQKNILREKWRKLLGSCRELRWPGIFSGRARCAVHCHQHCGDAPVQGSALFSAGAALQRVVAVHSVGTG